MDTQILGSSGAKRGLGEILGNGGRGRPVRETRMLLSEKGLKLLRLTTPHIFLPSYVNTFE